MKSTLILDAGLAWAAGQLMTVRLSPLTLPSGRVLGDFSAFKLAIRSDPRWASGKVIYGASNADPVGDGWPVAVEATGAVVAGVVTFTFTTPLGAGAQRYAVDAWGVLAGGGAVQLVPATWLTVGARVVAPG